MSFLLGELPPLETVWSALNQSTRNPMSCANELPAILQVAGWLEFEHGLASYAEVAYIRWMEVALASDFPIFASMLAKSLGEANYIGIAFRSDAYPFQALIEAVGDQAAGISAQLARRVYAQPALPWDFDRAARIKADIEAEAVHTENSSCPGWTICADRQWLSDQIQRRQSSRKSASQA